MANAYDLPVQLFDFGFIPHFEERVNELADLAEPEEWNYRFPPRHNFPILQNYLKYTWKRIAEEKKISVTADEQYICWNTGLITLRQEEIYILFNRNLLPNAPQYWHFYKFARAGQHDLNRFPRLPEIAHYFEDPSALVYNSRKELRVNYEHMVSENRDRFPAEVSGMTDFQIQNLLVGAVEAAKKRVARNYKTAIPQYYDGNLQMLLPLSLLDPSRADLAMVVENFSDFYRASTCLTLDMAYNNARQLARPDRDWLNP